MSALKKRAKDIEKRRAQDIDPEDDPFHQQDDEDESSDSDVPQVGGREHYESVGRSKLRKADQMKLDKKYSGVAVSRADLEDDNDNPFAPDEEDDDEDPFATSNTKERSGLANLERNDTDDSISEPAEGEESEDETGDELDGAVNPPRRRPGTSAKTPVNGIRDMDLDSDSEGDDRSDEQSTDEEMDVDGSEESDVSESERSDDDRPANSLQGREKLRAINKAETSESAVVSSLSVSAADRARKGAAVQQQQTAFDRLLDSRIKLQKALTLSNDMAIPEDEDGDLGSAAVSAEAAALSLWTTIDAIRCDILSHRESTQPNPKKRKISALEPSSSTPLSSLSTHSQELESASLPARHSTLNHWYTRTRPAVAPSASRSALTSASASSETTISSVLQTYLATSLPKLASSSTPAPHTYDDSPFYQSLLTALIASRTNAAAVSSTSLPSSVLPTSKNPKIRKSVDTKASKGRKLRYTVHEKLQNFMAAEDRSTWTDEGRREFFGSLFGQMQLGGGQEGTAEMDDDEGVNGEDADGYADAGEEGALRLFRSAAAVAS